MPGTRSGCSFEAINGQNIILYQSKMHDHGKRQGFFKSKGKQYPNPPVSSPLSITSSNNSPRFSSDLGWEVQSAMEAVAKSITSQPARAISRAVAREQELVACVWKWMGRSVTERIASTSSGAALGLRRPAISCVHEHCTSSRRVSCRFGLLRFEVPSVLLTLKPTTHAGGSNQKTKRYISLSIALIKKIPNKEPRRCCHFGNIPTTPR